MFPLLSLLLVLQSSCAFAGWGDGKEKGLLGIGTVLGLALGNPGIAMEKEAAKAASLPAMSPCPMPCH